MGFSLFVVHIYGGEKMNQALESLSGLEGLRTVDWALQIHSNQALTDVTALHEVTSVGYGLTITDNTELLTSDAEALRDAIGTDNIGSSVTISGNK